MASQLQLDNAVSFWSQRTDARLEELLDSWEHDIKRITDKKKNTLSDSNQLATARHFQTLIYHVLNTRGVI